MQEEQPRPLFTYGSLMEGLFNYQLYLAGKVMGKPRRARIKGELYHLTEKGYPALLVGDDWVYGEVFELCDFHPTLKELDTLENYYGSNHPENEYERKVVTVWLYNEQTQLFDEKIEVYCYPYRIDNDASFAQYSLYLPEGDWHSQALQKNK